MNNEILFSERQRFRKIWLWVFLLILFGISFIKTPLSDTEIIIKNIILILVLVLLTILRLDTEIR
jgi:membrane protein DedA with SNARE-associated domain